MHGSELLSVQAQITARTDRGVNYPLGLARRLVCLEIGFAGSETCLLVNLRVEGRRYPRTSQKTLRLIDPHRLPDYWLLDDNHLRP